ncbi:MAG: hypothetical protein AAF694_07085 [Bacteroidota bacterium]
MKLISNITPSAKGDHASRLVSDGITILKSSDLTPCCMEFAAHRDDGFPLLVEELGAVGKLVIPTPGGGKILEIMLRVVFIKAVPGIHGPVHGRHPIEEDTCIGMKSKHQVR